MPGTGAFSELQSPLKNSSLPLVHSGTSYSPPPCANFTLQGASLDSTFTPLFSSPTRIWLLSAKNTNPPTAPIGLGPAYSRGAEGGGGGGGGLGGSGGFTGLGILRTGACGAKNALRPLKRFASTAASWSCRFRLSVSPSEGSLELPKVKIDPSSPDAVHSAYPASTTTAAAPTPVAGVQRTPTGNRSHSGRCINPPSRCCGLRTPRPRP